MDPAAPLSSGDDDEDRIGPDDLTIRTPNGTVAEPASWLALVYSTLRKPGDFLVVSSGPPDMYAQALNHDGRFVLEYRDGSPDRHFRTDDVSLASVADALSQWMSGGRDFIKDHKWRPLSI